MYTLGYARLRDEKIVYLLLNIFRRRLWCVQMNVVFARTEVDLALLDYLAMGCVVKQQAL